ncbi:Voltage-dependent calcium channel subunit alpha-2/delta-4 [Nibea albiflora]|uniref:Voltage-dependent calcium channel subunit alpha-2/delta-4 n=1 Tax=Nibea albiflora TaxID=240163 RepID=A0ACB7FD90_NIBAL|nr:Voltage-dependent calcium channel subunit alpha-2/delta-4 [Nibea albiflora]
MESESVFKPEDELEFYSRSVAARRHPPTLHPHRRSLGSDRLRAQSSTLIEDERASLCVLEREEEREREKEGELEKPHAAAELPLMDCGGVSTECAEATPTHGSNQAAILKRLKRQMSSENDMTNFETARSAGCSTIEGVCPLSCESVVSILPTLFAHHQSSVLNLKTHFFLFCCCVQDLNCFLVDNNGFILLSKERNEVGRFFGEVDGSVMASLIKMGMYKKFLLDFNLCGLWHSDYFVDGHKQKKMEPLTPCDTAYPGFMYDSTVREANSLIKCGRCQKMFVVQQIPDSNLILVVTQADCDCSRQYGSILLEPKEIKYILH